MSAVAATLSVRRRTSDSGRSTLRAVRIAPAAIDALHNGSGWRLLSVHRHAINYVDRSGGLLSITEDRIRMGPFSIEVDACLGECTFGETRGALRRTAQGKFLLGGRMLDLTSAEIWDARPNWSALAAISWPSAFLPVMRARLRASSPPNSLARLCDLPDGGRVAFAETSLHDLPQRAATAAAVRVVRSLATDPHTLLPACSALAGTGVGLTPSGDDFLIGIVFGIHSTLSEAEARALAGGIHRAVTGRTNRISESWLAAAAEGQAIQAWHDLVEAILSDDGPLVDRACQRLIELGHTSGADALAGFLAFHLARTSANSEPG